MRSLIAVIAMLAIASLSATASFLDDFSYPDGTFPPEWTWTGDPRGAGVFEVHDETFVHVSGGHIHFFRDLEVCGTGVYEFDARDWDWGFAWRINPANPNAGSCFCFYHNDYWGWAYNFVEFDWSTLGGYPEGQYMWHNGWHTRIEHHYAGPQSGWVHVRIEDTGDHVRIWLDDDLIFDIDVTPIPDGYPGLGSSWADSMLPAFDNVSYSSFSPIEETSWSSIKALFR